MISTFQEDLKVGKLYENIVLNKIKRKYPKAHIIDGYCKDWDIFIPYVQYAMNLNCVFLNLQYSINQKGKPNVKTSKFIFMYHNTLSFLISFFY